MKIKGLDFLEKHVEKIVLAGTVVLLAGFGVMQFLGHPNAVEVGGKITQPADVDKILTQKAQALDAQIHSTRPIELPEIDTIADVFHQKRNLATTAARNNVPFGPRYFIDLEEGEVIATADVRFAEPKLPPLPEPLSHADVYNLDKSALEDLPEMAEKFPDEEPADIRAVSIETTLTTADLIKALKSGDPDKGIRPVPQSWYDKSLYIVDVIVEREELDANGKWSDPVVLDPVPGRPTLRNLLQPSEDSPQLTLDSLLEQRNLLAENIERPPFYIVRTNQWVPPAKAAEAGEYTEKVVDTPLSRLERDLQRKYQRRKELNAENERIDQEIKDLQDRAKDSELSDAVKRQIEGKNRRKQDNEKKIAKIDEDIQALVDKAKQIDENWVNPFDERGTGGRTGEGGRTTGGGSGTQPGEEPLIPGGRRSSSSAKEQPTLLELDSVTLWAHDITVKPGGVYRYRVSYEIFNPFSGKATRLSREQQHLADSFVIESSPSDWSDPVTVPQDIYYFIVAANPAQQGTPVARVSAEMYRYYDGYWRKADASLEPGDELAKSISVKRLPEETTASGPGGRNPGRKPKDKTLPTSRLVMELPVTLLDVLERPVKRVSELGTPIRDYEAILTNETGQIVVRIPYKEVDNSDRSWLTRAVDKADKELKALEG